MKTTIAGITWQGESIDDIEILRELPSELVRVLSETNGFILHHGALHVRGACLSPEWHSLRAAWHGPHAFHMLYDNVRATDIPFAQDQVGDQFLIRDGAVLQLFAETGEVELLTGSVEDFLSRSNQDIENFLNIGLAHMMQPGQLLLAYPPFIFQESGATASLKAIPVGEVILFHADLASQMRDVPDGARVKFKLVD